MQYFASLQKCPLRLLYNDDDDNDDDDNDDDENDDDENDDDDNDAYTHDIRITISISFYYNKKMK